jgi:hypothetical protein
MGCRNLHHLRACRLLEGGFSLDGVDPQLVVGDQFNRIIADLA